MLIAGALCAGRHVLYGSRSQIQPKTSLELMLFATVATIVGGIGNIWGAALAAMVLGLVQNASVLFIPSQHQGLLLYVFLFFAIIFFPRGHQAGRRESRNSHRRRVIEPLSLHGETVKKPADVRSASMEFIQVVIIMVGIYVILASSFNFVIGYAGLISIAHPIFFALGAYTSGILARDLGWPVAHDRCRSPRLSACLLSLAMSLPSLRVSGDY